MRRRGPIDLDETASDDETDDGRDLTSRISIVASTGSACSDLAVPPPPSSSFYALDANSINACVIEEEDEDDDINLLGVNHRRSTASNNLLCGVEEALDEFEAKHCGPIAPSESHNSMFLDLEEMATPPSTFKKRRWRPGGTPKTLEEDDDDASLEYSLDEYLENREQEKSYSKICFRSAIFCLSLIVAAAGAVAAMFMVRQRRTPGGPSGGVVSGVDADSIPFPSAPPSTDAPFSFASNAALRQAIMDYDPAVDPPMGDWDVSGVTDFGGLFFNMTDFNESIGSWKVSSGTSFARMFEDATSFQQDLSTWNVSQAEDLERMFFRASAFDSDLGDWNVAHVTSTKHMFYGASSFDQSLSQWNLSSIQTMEGMFRGISADEPNIWSQDLCAWRPYVYPFLERIQVMNLFHYTNCPRKSSPGATPHVVLCHECVDE